MIRRLVVAAALAAGIPACSAPPREPLVVFAAASLTEAFAEVADSLARDGVTVQFNFAGSQQLATQLEQGAHADVFASADERGMEKVRAAGRVDGTPHTFAHNHLVAIVPAAAVGRITRLEQLAEPGVKLVIGAEAVPVGRYTRDAIDRLAHEPGFGADYPQRVLANVVSEEENVRGVVSKVALGEADAGIVYRSDVTAAVAPRVRTIEIPERANVLATYPVAVVRGTHRAQAAARFVAFLRSPEGQRVLARHGFVPAEAP